MYVLIYLLSAKCNAIVNQPIDLFLNICKSEINARNRLRLLFHMDPAYLECVERSRWANRARPDAPRRRSIEPLSTFPARGHLQEKHRDGGSAAASSFRRKSYGSASSSFSPSSFTAFSPSSAQRSTFRFSPVVVGGGSARGGRSERRKRAARGGPATAKGVLGDEDGDGDEGGAGRSRGRSSQAPAPDRSHSSFCSSADKLS